MGHFVTKLECWIPGLFSFILSLLGICLMLIMKIVFQINIEVKLDVQFIDNLREFVSHLTKTMHAAVPGSLVIW